MNTINSYENAVIIYNKSTKTHVDKCDEIRYIHTGASKSTIVFHTGKSYEYNNNSFTWIRNPSPIKLDGRVFFHDGNPLIDIDQILAFGEWYKVFFKNEACKTYHKSTMRILTTCQNKPKAHEVLRYFIEITGNLDPDAEEDFLQKQLKEIVVLQDSALATLLEEKELVKSEWSTPMIFPFSTNTAQQLAVSNALQYNFSAIQGPPGTGKTQTILNIIANIILSNQTVAVVSGNNEATRNIEEKLLDNGFGYIGAFLGKKDNVKAFFENPSSTDQVLAQFPSDLQNIDAHALGAIAAQASDYLKLQMRIAELRQSIEEYEIEQAVNDVEYASRTHQINQMNLKANFTSAKLLQLASIFETLPEDRVVGFFDRVRFLFRYGIIKMKDYAEHKSDTMDYLHNTYYKTKIKELKNELQSCTAFLSAKRAAQILEDYRQTSVLLLQHHLYHRMDRTFQNFNAANYKFCFKKFTERFPLILSTTHALRRCSGTHFLYDYLIIDESSQVDMASALVALSCARHVVFVGDVMQLPHVVKTNDIKPLGHLFSQYRIPEYFEYCKHSILHCILKAYPNIPNVLLNEHYRCDPQIIGFCNKRFYRNQLVVHTQHAQHNGVSIITTAPHYARGRSNERQADIVKEEILPTVQSHSIGVVAPYRDQVCLLKEKLGGTILVDTVHKFQGKEKDVIVLSTVSNNVRQYDDEERIDFLNNPNLINVAISRAKKKLYVISSSEILKQPGSLLRDFEKYVSYFCSDTTVASTQVYSVFDLLYKDYAPILEDLKKRLKQVSNYDSENIMATILADICTSGAFGALDYTFNYPLRKILNTSSMTDPRDLDFILNPYTHCDFVIFSLLDKSIQLIIEVDGAQHSQSIQAERDRRKDRLLNEAGLPILRIHTTEIHVEEKIKDALRKAARG